MKKKSKICAIFSILKDKIKDAAEAFMEVFKKHSLMCRIKSRPLRAVYACFLVCCFVFLASLLINIYMVCFAKPYIYKNFEEVPLKTAVIIPGAKVYQGGYISTTFKDRILSGVKLFEAEKAQKLLISGDHGRKTYDEVNTGRKFILKNYPEIKHEDIFMDHAGFSTYETMYRASAVFCVKDAVISTQSFHLARSVYIARKLGIDAVGYAAEETTGFSRKTRTNWALREYLARVKAFFSVAFHLKPTYLGEEIPIDGDGTKSWD